MLDTLGILISSIVLLLVIVRAIQLDAVQPWFRPPKSGIDRSGLKLRPEGPSGDPSVQRAAARRGQNERSTR